MVTNLCLVKFHTCRKTFFKKVYLSVTFKIVLNVVMLPNTELFN